MIVVPTVIAGYRVWLNPLPASEGGGFVATVSDLPGCVGDGDTESAALKDAELAITEWLDEAIRLGRAIPARLN